HARQGAGAPSRPARGDAGELPDLPQRRFALAAEVRRQGGDGAHRPLDGRAEEAGREEIDPADYRNSQFDNYQMDQGGPVSEAPPLAPDTAVSDVAQLPPLTEEES